MHSVIKMHNYALSKSIKIPKNEQKYRDARLNWWARHKNQEWDKIIFTGECTFYLEAPNRQKWLKNWKIIFSETQKYSKQKINCLGAISALVKLNYRVSYKKIILILEKIALDLGKKYTHSL